MCRPAWTLIRCRTDFLGMVSLSVLKSQTCKLYCPSKKWIKNIPYRKVKATVVLWCSRHEKSKTFWSIKPTACFMSTHIINDTDHFRNDLTWQQAVYRLLRNLLLEIFNSRRLLRLHLQKDKTQDRKQVPKH